MKKIITLEKQTKFKELEKDLFYQIAENTSKNVSKSVLNSILNFSKSLQIIPSASVRGLTLEVVSN